MRRHLGARKSLGASPNAPLKYATGFVRLRNKIWLLFQRNRNRTVLFSVPSACWHIALNLSLCGSFWRRCDKLGYMDKHYSDISTLFQEGDDVLFRTILSNTLHVLHKFLCERPETTYSLRTRNHHKLLIPQTSDLGDRHFIIRSLYRNLY